MGESVGREARGAAAAPGRLLWLRLRCGCMLACLHAVHTLRILEGLPCRAASQLLAHARRAAHKPIILVATWRGSTPHAHSLHCCMPAPHFARIPSTAQRAVSGLLAASCALTTTHPPAVTQTQTRTQEPGGGLLVSLCPIAPRAYIEGNDAGVVHALISCEILAPLRTPSETTAYGGDRSEI